mmetsp:Transcript_1918/g.7966  ORF Transcript_1918/g.7966 Transcript_1918/m.7966 type:complete len:296 (-) Transcript_1918:2137-3024(-)
MFWLRLSRMLPLALLPARDEPPPGRRGPPASPPKRRAPPSFSAFRSASSRSFGRTTRNDVVANPDRPVANERSTALSCSTSSRNRSRNFLSPSDDFSQCHARDSLARSRSASVSASITSLKPGSTSNADAGRRSAKGLASFSNTSAAYSALSLAKNSRTPIFSSSAAARFASSSTFTLASSMEYVVAESMSAAAGVASASRKGKGSGSTVETCAETCGSFLSSKPRSSAPSVCAKSEPSLAAVMRNFSHRETATPVTAPRTPSCTSQCQCFSSPRRSTRTAPFAAPETVSARDGP